MQKIADFVGKTILISAGLGVVGVAGMLTACSQCCKNDRESYYISEWEKTILKMQKYEDELIAKKYDYYDIQSLKKYRFNNAYRKFGAIYDDMERFVIEFVNDKSLCEILPYNRALDGGYNFYKEVMSKLDGNIFDDEFKQTFMNAYTAEIERNKAFIDEKTKLGYSIEDTYILLVDTYYKSQFELFSSTYYSPSKLDYLLFHDNKDNKKLEK